MLQAGAARWSPDRLTELAATHAIDGVICATELEPWRAYADALQEIPLVTCDQALDSLGLPRVYIDHFKSTTDGLTHLVEKGARTLACFYGPKDDPCSSNRIRQNAYHAFASAHPEVSVVPMEAADDLVETGHEIGLTLEREFPEVDGVFTGSDDLAAGILLAAREQGRAVPGSLRILGFDDGPLAKVMEISTVRQPIIAMGKKSVRALSKIIGSPDAGGDLAHCIEHQLVPRGTT